MEEDTEYKKLPTDEKCVHKLWKARVAGYEEAAKLFKQIDDEKSPEWSKYLGLIKKFVTDSNAVAQEKGLEAALAFAENCGYAGKTVGEVMSGIVTKCIAAPKTKTKDLALQVTLMYVEIEKHEAVLDELVKGMDHKNPKIQTGCITATNSALKLFGNKVISIKTLVKKIQPVLTDRDKDVRTEGKALVVEMHRWIGPALEPHISSLQPVVLQELKDAFLDAGRAVPERYLRSQQVMAPSVSVGNDDGGGDDENEDEEDGGGGDPDMDPYELMDPVDIISKLPKDFYEKLEAKKWQERKEVLDALETLLKGAPRLEHGDYGDLVRAMKKVISKDSNVMLVALAGKCVAMLALGLKKRFGTYTMALMPCALDKFKEKKVNVVTALREAVDAMYPCTTIEAIAEDVVEALNNKNPAVRAETASFLSRAFANTQPSALNKKLIKTYVGALLKVLESADPVVRDQAAEALGTAMKLVGEKNVSPFIGQLDKLKEEKIKECMEKAVIVVKITGPKKEVRPKTAPSGKGDSKAGSTQPKSVKRPTTGGALKKPAPAKKTGTATKAAPVSRAIAPKNIPERELTPEEVDEKAEEFLDPAVWSGLTDVNWKVRIEAVEGFKRSLSDLSPPDVTAQLLVKILNKKPGLKDNNFQALKMRLETVKTVAEKFPVSTTCVDCILPEIVEKLSDPKCAGAASDALMALAEASRLEYVTTQALEYALDKQKNPRVQSEIFAWLSNALKDFGNVINTKNVLVFVKKALAANNPAVRVSAITFLGVLYMYIGDSLNAFIEGEKSAIKTQIQQELERVADEEVPAPTRGLSSLKGSREALDDNGGGDFDYNEEDTSAAEPVADVKTRIDISPQINDALLQEMNDKSWKVRNEALEKVKSMLTEAQLIKPSIGELPSALAPRLVDSNSKITQLALQLCEQLVTAIGPKAKQHVKSLFPGFFQSLGDSKAWVRSAAQQCINTWTSQCGVPSIFEGEIVFDALKSGGPILRAELWMWLAENLPGAAVKSIPKEELAVCVPLLYAALEDRGAEVRKGASEAVLGLMMHLGVEAMVRQAEKLKPGSKSVVHTAIEKAKPNMPVQPLPKSAESKAVKSGGAQAKGQGAQKSGQAKPAKGIVKSASSSSARGKKEDDDAFAPLLLINNTKHQRIIDDQKLKVLKWNFLTPREEFFDLLKDQMATAGFNKSLVANMFHADFRYHIKAIESLMEDLSENGQALVCNLDLIFKWLSLRFFDTNPSVLLKGLEYLNSVFTHLTNEDYHMAEYEASCFIPYLVLKVGDPKDTVRNGVKALLKHICVIYSVSKLFGYLMDGLKTKNARQRTECLEVMGTLIESYGISICGTQPAAAFKEIARQISDRDNSVRNAALNCVVQAYFLEGEKVYKMIGQISDKDMSLLEERIKRAAKGKDTTNRKSMLVPLSSTGRPIQPEIPKPVAMEQQQVNIECDDDEEDQQMAIYPPPQMRPQSEHRRDQPRPLSTGPFRLDPGTMASIENGLQEDIQAMTRRPVLQEMDLSFLDEPTPQPQRPPTASNLALSSPSRTMHPLPRPPAVPMTPNLIQLSPQTPRFEQQENSVTRTISNIASPNLSVAIGALSQINSILSSNRANLMAPYEEQLLSAISEQLQILQRPNQIATNSDLFDAYRFVMTVLTSFYEGRIAGRNVSSGTVASLVDQLLKLLVSRALEKNCTEGEDKLVRVTNVVCVKVLERSDHTALIIALIHLLDRSVSGDPPSARYQELEMKCLWKVMKLIPSWDSDSLDYNRLMFKLHEFFKTYPSSYWKRNPTISDTPFRTIKTMVHTLVKKKGGTILNNLTLIPDVNSSELYAYLQKLFKSLKIDVNTPGESPPVVVHHKDESPKRPPRLVQEELSLILKRIGEKEHSKEALGQLYDFTERNPQVDIWVCLKDVSNFFRSYIERGLKEVAEERRLGVGQTTAPITLAHVHQHALSAAYALNLPSNNNLTQEQSDDLAKGHSYYSERLRSLRAKLGLNSESPSNSQSRSPVIDNRTLADTIDENAKQNIDPKFDLPTLHQTTTRQEPQMDALKQKLQQIKSANR